MADDIKVEDTGIPEVSPLDMSDEDFLNAAEPVSVVVPPVDEEVTPAEIEEEVPAVDPAPVIEEKIEPVEDPDKAPGEAKGAEEGAAPKDKENVPPKVDSKEAKPDDKKGGDQSEAAATIDYKVEYERLLKPFKANGREINVKNVDDAISLMQMGANYNKRMASLKPNLKIIKLLENNQLLDETKLSYLIDLDKKDPKAINQLIKDSGIDPADLDVEKASEYAPKTHKITDSEIDLDTVLDEIQDTPTYNRMIKIVSKDWDGQSKQAIANQPQLLKLINDHMESGIYDLINDEVENERAVGRLKGVSDIEAYKSIGEMIQNRGGFNHLGSSQEKPNNEAPVVIPPKQKASDNPALKDKRRAAGSAPATVPAPVSKSKDNLLSLSDEEFLKLPAVG